jgi:adenylylsulfate kinase
LSIGFYATGDELKYSAATWFRQNLSHGLGFSREDRDRKVLRVAFIANLLARNGVVVIVAVVSPSVWRAMKLGDYLGASSRCTLTAQSRNAKDATLKGCTDEHEPANSEVSRESTIRMSVPLQAELIVSTNRQSSDDSTASIESALIDSGLLTVSGIDLY